MICSRRAFLQTLFAFSAAGAGFFRLSSAFAMDSLHQAMVVGGGGGAVFLDLKTQEQTFVPIGLPAHSFVPHPTLPMTFLGIQKWGP